MRALVSGGTGLVGRYIVETLLEAGYAVTVTGRREPTNDRFSRPVEFKKLDLDTGDHRGVLFDGIDSFIHAAFDHAPGRYRGGEGDDPEAFRLRNLDGSVKLFEAANASGVRRAVFLSSRAVYDGVPPGVPLTEELKLAPSSLYGEIKLLCEQALAQLDGPDFITASLRLTGVYGELRPNKWDSRFADYLAGRAIPVRAGSEVHGRDAGQAVRLMLETDADLVGGEVFNISDLIADTHDILAPLKTMARCSHPLPKRADKSDVAEMQTDKIRLLGWKPGGWELIEEALNNLAKDGVSTLTNCHHSK